MPSRFARACVALVCLSHAAWSQAGPGRGGSWATETIESRALGRRTIYLATPAGYDHSRARYPVLVLLDADDSLQFELWLSQAAYIADNAPGVPQVIAVGIANGQDRLHDMLPPAMGTSLARFKTAGGAAAFADFILEEVLPHIRATYRTLPSTIIAGHSAGGLFALDAAAHHPGTFQGVIAMDPSIWYNDSSGVTLYAQRILGDTRRPRIFVSSGGVDDADIDITSRHFAERMSAEMPAGTFEYRRYPDLWHSMTPMSFGDGFRFIFKGVQSRSLAIRQLNVVAADSGAIIAALALSKRQYANAARALGMPPELPEQVVNSFGYSLLNAHRNSLAVSVLRQNARDFSTSANVYDSLADGLLALGDTAAAIRNLELSVQTARRNGEPVAAETQAKLAKLTSRRH